MDVHLKKEILRKAQEWFCSTIVENHLANTIKLEDPREFNINPFLATYLANFLTGNSSPESIARVLVYARTLSSSINTSFGTNIQKFSSTVLASFGSTTAGIDVEFVDQMDGQKKYCQLKAGPNTINKDDVETIHGHFGSVMRLAKTNNLRIATGDLIIGVLYGERRELSGHYLRLESQYHHPVFAGKEFWHHLTGDKTFYQDLIVTIMRTAEKVDGKRELENTIQALAKTEQVIQLSALSKT